MSPSVDRLFAALEATWPPASSQRLGPFRLRDGAGGGKRVSAAVQDGEFDAAIGPNLALNGQRPGFATVPPVPGSWPCMTASR